MLVFFLCFYHFLVYFVPSCLASLTNIHHDDDDDNDNDETAFHPQDVEARDRYETKTRRSYFLRRDRDVKIHVALIAEVQLFFTFITS